MIKVGLLELDKHRNETSFRYYVANQNLFRDVGIEFTTSDSCDYAMVGQASIIDKTLSLEESVDRGLKFISKINGDYIIFDGQDSTTLMGTFDVFSQSSALLFLKTVYLNDFDLYKQGWANGRMYWGKGDYSVPNIDEYKDKMKLSGTNWGNTLFPNGVLNFHNYDVNKKYDICGMFQYPLLEEVFEHELCQTPYYNKCRKPVYDLIQLDKYNACKLIDGKRIPQEEYLQNMYNSKIIFSPYEYGAYGAPRDVQSAQFGSILIKPRMDWINTTPNMYVEDETYIACEQDFSDLEEKVDYVLSNFNELQPYIVKNFRKKLKDAYNPIHLVKHTHKLFSDLESVTYA